MITQADRHAFLGLVINPLPPAVRGALVADQSFCAKVGITPSFWLPLDADNAVRPESLQNAIRAGLAGETKSTIEIRDAGPRRAGLKLRKGGSISIRLKDKTYTFRDVDPLASDLTVRMNALDRIFAEKPLLGREEDQWRDLLSGRAPTDREYVDLMSDIESTPEGVKIALQRPQALSDQTLVPDDIRYFERLVAPNGSATSLESFIATELSEVRRSQLSRAPVRALRRIAFSAVWQRLIPFDMLGSIGFSAVMPLIDCRDPFSLLFGFELCCSQHQADDRFVALGQSFLQKLLLDGEESLNRCKVFSAAAMISVATLHRVLGAHNAPTYWTRLAALAHAGVLADTLGSLPDKEGFYQWARHQFYQTYIWQSLIDRREAPRWKAEWIDPNQLFAELVGRVGGGLERIEPSARPIEWVGGLESALRLLKESETMLGALFPGPFDDYASTALAASVREVVDRAEEELERVPHLSDVSVLAGLAYTTMPSTKIVDGVLRIVSAPLTHPVASDREEETAYLQLAAHVAATARSMPLANAVINRCFYEIRNSDDAPTIMTLVGVIVGACASVEDPSSYRAFLGKSFATVCYSVCAPKVLKSILSAVEILIQRDRKLISYFARARAVAETKAGGQ